MVILWNLINTDISGFNVDNSQIYHIASVTGNNILHTKCMGLVVVIIIRLQQLCTVIVIGIVTYKSIKND